MMNTQWQHDDENDDDDDDSFGIYLHEDHFEWYIDLLLTLQSCHWDKKSIDGWMNHN